MNYDKQARFMSVCLLATGALFLSTSAHATRRLLSFYGANGAGNDFENGLYRDACMKEKGWSVKSIVSDSDSHIDDPGAIAFNREQNENFKKGLSTVVSAKDQIEIPHIQCPENTKNPDGSFNYPEGRAAGEKAVDTYVNAILKANEDLKQGDEFLLKIFAHGNSNCRAIDNSKEGQEKGFDFSKGGIQNNSQCDHWFAVKIPGCTAAVLLPSKKLAPALKTLQSRGVKTAVEIQSCYGGAAIKDFAQDGICAQAFSTPDAALTLCTDPIGNATLATSLPGLMTAQYCSPKSASQSAALDRVTQAEGRAASPGQKGCLDEGMKQLPPSVNNQSMSSLIDQLRQRDLTANQPMGSDGPFWVVGSLSLLGGAGKEALESGPELECAIPSSAQEFFDKIVGNVQSITNAMFKTSCKLNSNVDVFFKSNREVLDQYYQAYQAHAQDLNHHVNAANQMILKALSGNSAEALARAVADAHLPSNLQGADREKALKQRIGADSLSFVAFNIIALELPIPDGPGKEEFQQKNEALRSVCEKALGGAEKFKALAADLAAARKKTQEFNNDLSAKQKAVTGLERKLYDTLKGSKEYQDCIAVHPELKKAKEACESFVP